MPQLFSKIDNLERSHDLVQDLEKIYLDVDLVFIPFLFNHTLSERSLVKVLMGLEIKQNTWRLLLAGSYFLYFKLNNKKTMIEFVLGKVIGYYVFTHKQTEHSLKAFECIT